MIARLLIATCITAGTLTGVAWQRAGLRDGVRPSLLVFTDPQNCAPCRKFDAAFANDPQFRNALTGAFRCHPAYTPQRQPELFRKHNITSVPTFLVVDAAGNELRRVTGYDGKNNLWRNLTQDCVDGVCPTPTDPPDRSATLDRLRQANESLQAERDQLRYREQQLADELAKARELARRSGADQQAIDAAIARADQLESQLAELARRQQAADAAATRAQAEAERLREQLSRPSAPLWTQPEPPPQTLPSPPADISPEITVPASPPGESTSGKWVDLLSKLGTGVLTVLAPEFAIPGSLLIAAGGYALRRRTNPGRPPPESKEERAVGPAPFPRRLDEARQLRDIRGYVERRCPEFDTAVGRVVQDELELSRQLGTTEDNQTLKDFWERVRKRVDHLMPPSVREYLDQ